jgi:O-acetyl-ADP-ribose deacetylase (regulator of RNase III)
MSFRILASLTTYHFQIYLWHSTSIYEFVYLFKQREPFLERKIGNTIVSIIQADITELDADAIVNAANSDLWMGSGVAGAIKSKGGTEIETEAMAQGPIQPGQAVITDAGELKAKKVIHCAGMPPRGKATIEYVRTSVDDALKLAAENGISSIAFPAIGAGVGGLTIRESINAILDSVTVFSKNHRDVENVILVGYNTTSYEELRRVFEDWRD